MPHWDDDFLEIEKYDQNEYNRVSKAIHISLKIIDNEVWPADDTVNHKEDENLICHMKSEHLIIPVTAAVSIVNKVEYLHIKKSHHLCPWNTIHDRKRQSNIEYSPLHPDWEEHETMPTLFQVDANIHLVDPTSHFVCCKPFLAKTNKQSWAEDDEQIQHVHQTHVVLFEC